MSILSAFRAKYFVDAPLMEAPKDDRPTTNEIGYSNSMLYGSKDFARYNPDDLVSKKGTAIYNRMMLDDQVKAVMRFKQYAVISRDYYFDVETDEDGNENEQQATMAKFFTTVIKQMQGNFSDKLIEILSAMITGFSITEKVYKPIKFEDKPYWGIGDIKLRPFDSFSGGMITDEHGNLTGVKQRFGGKEVDSPLSKLIHFVYQPDKDRIFGESDLRAAYRSYWSKDIAIKFQNIHLERHAGGFMWASIDGALSSTDKSNLEGLLKNITAMTSAMLPKNITLEQLMPLNTEAFEKAVAQHDKAIAKSVLVPNLLGMSEQGNTGSYSQSQTQLEAFFWILEQIANALAETLNEQLFRQLALWNFGTEDYPLFKFEEISHEQKRAIATLWGELVRKRAVTKSDTDESYIRRLLGFPEKAEDAVEETPPTEDINPDDEEYFPAKPDNSDWIDGKPEDKKQNILKAFADRPWLKRINFTQIENDLDRQDGALADEMAAIMGKVRLHLETIITRTVGDRSLGNLNPSEIADIQLPKGLMSELRRTLRNNLTTALDTAYEQARAELPKRNNKENMDKLKAEKFLSSRAMKIAGVIEQNTLNAVQTVLENGIRYDKSLKAVVREFDTDTNLLAVLPKIDAAGKAINVPARLANIARTNTAYAFNEARQALFQEPEYKGFIEAFEYSAILDDATTEICQTLDGRVQRDWGSMTPPNHFQCRSLLVPITIIDDWNGIEDKIPAAAKPDKGFMCD